MTGSYDLADRRGGQRAHFGQPQVVRSAAVRIPVQQPWVEVGQPPVQRGGAQRDRPQPGGEGLVRHGHGDPRLGRTDTLRDFMNAESYRIRVNLFVGVES